MLDAISSEDFREGCIAATECLKSSIELVEVAAAHQDVDEPFYQNICHLIDRLRFNVLLLEDHFASADYVKRLAMTVKEQPIIRGEPYASFHHFASAVGNYTIDYFGTGAIAGDNWRPVKRENWPLVNAALLINRDIQRFEMPVDSYIDLLVAEAIRASAHDSLPAVGAVFNEATLPAEFREGGKTDGQPLVLPYLENNCDWKLSRSALTNAERSGKTHSVKVLVDGKRKTAYPYQALATIRMERTLKDLDENNEGH